MTKEEFKKNFYRVIEEETCLDWGLADEDMEELTNIANAIVGPLFDEIEGLKTSLKYWEDTAISLYFLKKGDPIGEHLMKNLLKVRDERIEGLEEEILFLKGESNK